LREVTALKTAYIGLALVAIAAVAYFVGPKLWNWALPPHEFAYGAPLASLQELPAMVGQFLTLEALDPTKTRIEVSMLGGSSDSGKDIKALAAYFRAKAGSQPGADNLLSDLERINSIRDVQRKVDALLSTLVDYKDLIRDEPNQDKIIIFIYYRLRVPSLLSADAKNSISSMLRTLDTEKQARAFDRDQCPSNYLEGNVNIYPLAIENRGWYKSVDLPGDPTRPVLEIRFMGLRGIFRYLLDSMQHNTGLAFAHLDGEDVSPTNK
jgi:hypothetical protein